MMRTIRWAAAGAAILVVGALALTGPARAQSAAVAQAMAAGAVGEQSDGYLGVVGGASAAVTAEVEAINIKRRAAYTDLAAKRGVTVSDMAAATGCQTLSSRVKPGQKYRIAGAAWQTKGDGPIALPGYCATAG